MRDVQRQKVYDWERSGHIGPEVPLSIEGCGWLIHHVCREYGVTSPPVWDGANDKTAYSHSRKGIKLPAWAQTAKIALHEVAHWILTRAGVCDGHGPQFVRLYVDLLVRYHDQDELHLVSSLIGVLDIAPRGTGPQRKLDVPVVRTPEGVQRKRARAREMLREADAEDAFFRDLPHFEYVRIAASRGR